MHQETVRTQPRLVIKVSLHKLSPHKTQNQKKRRYSSAQAQLPCLGFLILILQERLRQRKRRGKLDEYWRALEDALGVELPKYDRLYEGKSSYIRLRQISDPRSAQPGESSASKSLRRNPLPGEERGLGMTLKQKQKGGGQRRTTTESRRRRD